HLPVVQMLCAVASRGHSHTHGSHTGKRAVAAHPADPEPPQSPYSHLSPLERLSRSDTHPAKMLLGAATQKALNRVTVSFPSSGLVVVYVFPRLHSWRSPFSASICQS